MVKLPECHNKIYPDSAEGAKEYLFADSSLKATENTICIMDQQVYGVWMVTHLIDHCGMKCDAIVYLAGYKQPLGDLRERNDFETFEGWQSDDI